jgi:ribosome-associated translation inhibitor RaiA
VLALNDLNSEIRYYRGLPLVRCEDVLFYGNINEDYVTKIEVKSIKNNDKIKLSDKLTVQMVSSSSAARGRNLRIKKSSEKNGLYEALDVAFAWLERLPKKTSEKKKV